MDTCQAGQRLLLRHTSKNHAIHVAQFYPYICISHFLDKVQVESNIVHLYTQLVHTVLTLRVCDYCGTPRYLAVLRFSLPTRYIASLEVSEGQVAADIRKVVISAASSDGSGPSTVQKVPSFRFPRPLFSSHVSRQQRLAACFSTSLIQVAQLYLHDNGRP